MSTAGQAKQVTYPEILVVPSHVQIIAPIDGERILRSIESIGRTCYQSYDRTTYDSCYRFVKMLISSGHEACLEHESLSIRFVVDRAIQNELVRHRIASYAVESTRYVNYSLERNGAGIKVICPPNIKEGTKEYDVWKGAMQASSDAYFELLKYGRPEIARSVLPLALKTEVVMTANLRQWRAVFKLRCDRAAHLQVREVMLPLLATLKQGIPVVFDDLDYPESL